MAKTLEDIQKSILIGSDPVSDDDNKFDQAINVGIMKTNEDFNPTQSQIQERAKYIKRGHESALMNDTTRSSVVIRHDGQINISANRYAQFKLNPSGKIIEEALESVQLSNRHKIQTDDIVLNEHKLNPYLYELTDIKKLTSAYNDEMYVGNFCLFGSVLTKSWDMNLKRYVLIRRPARMPMFSTVLNVPEINTGLGVSDPLKIDENLLAKSTKGYQVNAVISDANSLIGKEGQTRFGTNAGNIISYGDGTGAEGSSGQVGNITLKGSSNAQIIWNFLKAEGFSDQGAAGLIGNLQQESQCNPKLAEIDEQEHDTIPETGGYGIAQWTYVTRVEGLKSMAAQLGKPVGDMSVQLTFMKKEALEYGCWEPMKKMTDIEEATRYWEDKYEGAGTPMMHRRIQFAHEAYNSFAGKS